MQSLVDPDLFDLWVVEESLQRAEPGNHVIDPSRHCGRVEQQRHGAGRRPVFVVSDDVVNQSPYPDVVAERVDATTPNQLADLIFNNSGGVHAAER